MRTGSIMKRLERLERLHRASEPNLYLFTIDDGKEYETRRELDQELQKPQYENKVILINDKAAMREELKKQKARTLV